MEKKHTDWSLLGIFAISAVVSIAVGCATTTIGSNASGSFSIPQVVSPADNVPEELQPYVSRFEEMLAFRGFKVGTTTDPRALHFHLELGGLPNQATVVAYIIQGDRTVVSASAIDKKSILWRSVDKADKDELMKRLADNAINQFDIQLGKFVKQVQIIKAPGDDSEQSLDDSGLTGFGTAFAIKSPNTFLTARHVIVGARDIKIFCGHDQGGPAVVESNDAGNDIAVLRSDVKAKAFLELAPADSVSPGDHVFTMGFPFPDLMGFQPKYTDGVVSSLSGINDSKNVMQITVPIQPGNSGGPLVDLHGKVVGVIVSTAALPYFYRHTGTVPQNVNYAVPAYYAYPLVKDITPADSRPIDQMSSRNRVTSSVCLVVVKE